MFNVPSKEQGARHKYLQGISAQLHNLLCSHRCGREVGLGEERKSTTNIIFRKDLFVSLWKSTTKTSHCQQFTNQGSYASKQQTALFRVASQGTLKPSWHGLEPQKLLHFLLKPSFPGVRSPKTHFTNLLVVTPKYPKGTQCHC